MPSYCLMHTIVAKVVGVSLFGLSLKPTYNHLGNVYVAFTKRMLFRSFR